MCVFIVSVVVLNSMSELSIANTFIIMFIKFSYMNTHLSLLHKD